MQVAASKKCPNIFNYFLQHAAANVNLKPAFLSACEAGDKVIVSSLLHLDRIDPSLDNYEALKRAAASGNLNVVKLLVEFTDQDDGVIELSQIPPQVFETRKLEMLKFLTAHQKIKVSHDCNKADAIASDRLPEVQLSDEFAEIALAKGETLTYSLTLILRAKISSRNWPT